MVVSTIIGIGILLSTLERPLPFSVDILTHRVVRSGEREIRHVQPSIFLISTTVRDG